MDAKSPHPTESDMRGQRKIGALILGLAVLATTLTGCGGGAAGASPQETVTVTAKPKTKPKAKYARMGSFVGKNGAAAQQTLERAGVVNLEMASADPDAKIVLMPSNWRVTAQEPKAGTKIRTGEDGTLVILTMRKLASG